MINKINNFKVRGFVLILGLVFVIQSCKNDLDKSPYTSSDTETVFSDLEQADMFVQGCYRNLVPTELFYHLGAGDGVTYSSEDASTNNSKYNISNYFFDATSPFTVTDLYKEEYSAIESANIAISKLKKMEESEKRNALLGEAKTIRAYSYHNLIRIYGDVPAVWSPLEELDPDDEATFYPERTSRDSIYDHIVADLEESMEYIPWFSESGFPTNERITKEAAYALLARISLYAAGYSLRWDLNAASSSTRMARRSDNNRINELYQIASDATEEVMRRGSNRLIQEGNGKSGFENLWYNFDQRNFGVTDPEVLWHIANLGPNTNSKFGVYAHPGSRGGRYGSRKAMQSILPNYYLSFDENDTRRDVTCAPYSIYFLDNGGGDDTWVDVGTTYSSIMPGKFRISWCVEPQAAASRNLNIPILRYADVLLMYAEAQNYLNNGPSSGAKDALREVRERAGVGLLAIPSDQESFERAIVQERKWEFANELNLRTDLIRMNRLSEELNTTVQSMKDLSDRKGDYVNTPIFRLYKYHQDAQSYGDDFLGPEYIELTNPSDIELITNVPKEEEDYEDYQTRIDGVLEKYGVNVGNGEKWYPVNMFEAYTSSFNGDARKAIGFKGGFNTLQIGAIIYTQPTGSMQNNGQYPDWIEASDGSDGLYYGFKENHSELLPFANLSAGHPLIDNPNLTQLPGY